MKNLTFFILLIAVALLFTLMHVLTEEPKLSQPVKTDRFVPDSQDLHLWDSAIINHSEITTGK